jgi:hypothetical protein
MAGLRLGAWSFFGAWWLELGVSWHAAAVAKNRSTENVEQAKIAEYP